MYIPWFGCDEATNTSFFTFGMIRQGIETATFRILYQYHKDIVESISHCFKTTAVDNPLTLLRDFDEAMALNNIFLSIYLIFQLELRLVWIVLPFQRVNYTIVSTFLIQINPFVQKI